MHVLWLQQRVNGCDNQSPHHLCDKLCDHACVCMCVYVNLNDMFCISLPLEGSFSVRYTITLTGVLICKQGQDKCMCHSQPHGIPSSHARGREVRNSRGHDSEQHNVGEIAMGILEAF